MNIPEIINIIPPEKLEQFNAHTAQMQEEAVRRGTDLTLQYINTPLGKLYQHFGMPDDRTGIEHVYQTVFGGGHEGAQLIDDHAPLLDPAAAGIRRGIIPAITDRAIVAITLPLISVFEHFSNRHSQGRVDTASTGKPIIHQPLPARI